jgi:hypothetical protein
MPPNSVYTTYSLQGASIERCGLGGTLKALAMRDAPSGVFMNSRVEIALRYCRDLSHDEGRKLEDE